MPLPNLLQPSFLDESPRWILLKGDLTRAMEVLKRAAKVNKTSLPPDSELEAILRPFIQVLATEFKVFWIHIYGCVKYIYIYTTLETTVIGQNYWDLLPIKDKLEIYRLFSVCIYFNALPRGLGYVRLSYY